MAALNLDGFSTPVNNFAGLHKLADSSHETQYRNDQLRERKEGKKAATGQWLTNYLDPKDHLTGTNYDPEIVKGFDDLLQEGAALANEGADPNMILMALSPKVAKLNEYSTKAKLVNQRIKEGLSLVPSNGGYNKSEWDKETRKLAFYNDKGEMKDISEVDPNIDWMSEVVAKYPERITTDAGIDEFVKNSPKVTNTGLVKRTNPLGGFQSRKTKVTAPAWMIPNPDGEGMIPKFEYAKDGDKVKTHTFTDSKGNKKEEPVKIFPEDEYNSIISSKSEIKDWMNGQLKLAGYTDLNSTQAKQAARAIMFMELKRRNPANLEDVEEIKANPAPRISIRVDNKGTTSEIPYIDLYKSIEAKTDEVRTNPIVSKVTGKPMPNAVPVNSLDDNEQDVVMAKAKKADGNINDISQIYINRFADGIAIVREVDDVVLGKLSKAGVNVSGNQSLGIKAKQKAVTDAKNTPTKMSDDDLKKLMKEYNLK